MARGSEIVVSSPPRGVHIEGYVKAGVTTLKPGMAMEVDYTIALIGDRWTFKLYTADADGGRPKGPLVIANIDHLQGKTATDTYAAGARVFGWIPAIGEEMNVVVADIAGTGDDHAIGEMLIPDSGTGKFVATTGTPETEPFCLLETITDPTVDTLAWAWYTGY